MSKLIFLDIDGTIAMPGQAPSAETIQAIQYVRSRGNKVFLSTGRSEDSIPAEIKTIEFDGGIYHSGGKVYIGDQVIFDQPMNPVLVSQVQAILQSIGIFYSLECSSAYYKNSVQLKTTDISNEASESSELKRMFLRNWNKSNQKKIEDYQGESVYKINFMAEASVQVEAVVQALSGAAKTVTFENLTPDVSFLVGDISDWSINKGNALKLICQHLNITSEQCVAFGDSMNDAEILIAAGTGVAMGNSCDKLKQLANLVCGPCEAGGLANALWALFTSNY